MDQAIGGTQMSTLKRQGEDSLLLCVCTLIANLCEALNLTKPMGTVQAYDAACTLVSRFYFLKLEELIYIFREGKAGKYGQLYNRLDVQVLCEWCEKYWSGEERARHLEIRNSTYKTMEKEPMSLESARQLAAVFQKIAPKEVKDPIEPKTQSYEEWLEDFKAKADQMTIHELKAWYQIGIKENQKDIMDITDTIIGEYNCGLRIYPI